MGRVEFVCADCGKRIRPYKHSTTTRRKCAGCGSYHLKEVAPSMLGRDGFPLVSVVIPTHEGKHHLEKCLPSLMALDYPQDRIEIIVVDNASTDGTKMWLERVYPKVRVVRREENHYCRANNAGIAASKGEFIALLNNDTTVERAWLNELVGALQGNARAGGAGSKVLLLSGRIHTTGQREQPNHHWGDRGFEEDDRGQYDKLEEADSLCGVSVLFRRACIEDVGLQDERFVAYYEDVDYSLRCRAKGWALLYVPASAVHHFYNGTASKLQQGGMSFSRYYTERNRLLLLAKHCPEKIPEAISTHSHFYVEKEYRILYESLPVVIEALMVSAGEKLPVLLEQLFSNLRKVAVYEGEGLRTERLMYQHRVRQLEEEWQRNLARELKRQESRLRRSSGLALERERESHAARVADLEMEKQRTLEETHMRLEEEGARGLSKLRSELEEERGRAVSDLMWQSAERDRQAHEEIVRLQDCIVRQERELGHLSHELASLRQHPLRRMADRMLLATMREGTKEARAVDLKVRLAAKEQDLCTALARLEESHARHLELQGLHEQKVQEFLATEREATLSHAEALELQKMLSSLRSEADALLKETRWLHGRIPRPAEDSTGWIPPADGNVPHLLTEPSAKPAEVHLSIINRCFFRCEHCDIWKNKKRSELSTDEVKELIDRLHRWLGEFTLHVAGGEPFMRRDLLDVLRHATGKGISVILTTNGWRIDARVAEELTSIDLHTVNVSVDGLEDAHDSMRGVKDSYKRAVRALRFLNAKKKSTRVCLTTVVARQSLPQLPALVDWTAQEGLNGITLQALCNDFSSDFSWDWWRRSPHWPSDKEEVNGIMDRLQAMKLEGAPLNNTLAHLEGMRHYFLNPGRHPGACRVGLRTLHLNERGDFLLCWNMPPIGNVLTHDPAQLWSSHEARTRRHQIQRCARECFILNCNYLAA